MLNLSAEALEGCDYQALSREHPILMGPDNITQLFWERHQELQESIDNYFSRPYGIYRAGSCLLGSGVLSIIGSSVAVSKDVPYSGIALTVAVSLEIVGLGLWIGAAEVYNCYYRRCDPSVEVREAYDRVMLVYEEANVYLNADELSDKNKDVVTDLKSWYVTSEDIAKPLTDVVYRRWLELAPMLNKDPGVRECCA